jgi:histidinol dehydrogenase
MAIDWTRLLQQTAKHGLGVFTASRGAAADASGRPMVTQIKADMSNIMDLHRRRHPNEWLTVTGTEALAGTRYVCLGPNGYGVWVDGSPWLVVNSGSCH